MKLKLFLVTLLFLTGCMGQDSEHTVTIGEGITSVAAYKVIIDGMNCLYTTSYGGYIGGLTCDWGK